MVKSLKNKLLAVSFLLAGGCGFGPANTIPGTSAPVEIAASPKPPAVNQPNLEILIEQKKNNGELISIGSKGVGAVSIDGFDYPLAKLIKNQLRIEIPRITPGKHELGLSLYMLKTPLTVPLIIPQVNIQTVFVILRLNIDETRQELIKLEYGYDLDRNGIIDQDMERFESEGLKRFFLINPNGQRIPIDISLNTGRAVPDQNAPPPGVVPSSQTGKTIDTSQPQVPVPEAPKPSANTTELYPLPPTTNATPVPVNVPGDRPLPTVQPPTPLPQLPNLL